jgi:hypothetical protein
MTDHPETQSSLEWLNSYLSGELAHAPLSEQSLREMDESSVLVTLVRRQERIIAEIEAVRLVLTMAAQEPSMPNLTRSPLLRDTGSLLKAARSILLSLHATIVQSLSSTQESNESSTETTTET